MPFHALASIEVRMKRYGQVRLGCAGLAVQKEMTEVKA
jgi:hypothetical protein